MKRCWEDFTMGVLPQILHRGCFSSVALISFPHPSHWSPLASSNPQNGQVPFTKRSARNLHETSQWSFKVWQATHNIIQFQFHALNIPYLLELMHRTSHTCYRYGTEHPIPVTVGALELLYTVLQDVPVLVQLPENVLSNSERAEHIPRSLFHQLQRGLTLPDVMSRKQVALTQSAAELSCVQSSRNQCWTSHRSLYAACCTYHRSLAESDLLPWLWFRWLCHIRPCHR